MPHTHNQPSQHVCEEKSPHATTKRYPKTKLNTKSKQNSILRSSGRENIHNHTKQKGTSEKAAASKLKSLERITALSL
jgi:hypothetical protein